MKTFGNLFETICSFDNLRRAAHDAERGKTSRDVVVCFHSNLEREILGLRSELLDRSYRPGKYKTKRILHPKPRLISAAPYRDRVVHHALCRVVMPLFERRMIDDLHSNRPGKGTHAAIRRCQEHARRFPYVLKCDIRKYFPSMDHEVLKAAFRRTIRCRDTLWLMDLIVDSSNPQEPVCNVFPGDDLAAASARRVGLPIGNLTSQWFGGIYLDGFDHWVTESLRIGHYIRYVDDFVLFHDSKAHLAACREAISGELVKNRLKLNERKSRTYRTRDGVTFLGQRIWPNRRRLRRENVVTARRRLRRNARQYVDGEMSRKALEMRWHSWRGHAMQANAGPLIDKIREDVRHVLGATGT